MKPVTCPTKKTRYRHPNEAARALQHIRRHPQTEVIPCRSYECPICDGWHLTSQEVTDQPPTAFEQLKPARTRKRKRHG